MTDPTTPNRIDTPDDLYAAARRARRADPAYRHVYEQGVEVTVTIRNLNGTFDEERCTHRVMHEFAVNDQLATPALEEAAVAAVREIAEKVLGVARHEKRERERLEMMLGGPATPARMAAHIATLANTPREPGDANHG